MAIDFHGIDNVGEFYSGHYLDAVLDGDLKETFSRWRAAKTETGRRQPFEALSSLSPKFFKMTADAGNTSDPAQRLKLAMGFHAHFIEALGYDRRPGMEPVENGVVPVHTAVNKGGSPYLWIVDAPLAEHTEDDPLGTAPLAPQLAEGFELNNLPPSNEQSGPAPWRELLEQHVFQAETPPRRVLMLCGREALLVDRHKWPQGKYLRFKLGDLYSRKESKAFRALAGLLHRDVLAPTDGRSLHDTLDENSHKHAYAVSEDLKHGVRRAVELLANEAVYYRREKQKKGVFTDDDLASDLTAETLTWLYRLLFLFYVEARGAQLGTVPMKSETYRKGYSLENLRELELVPLTSEAARNGTFIHQSLTQLFDIVNVGFPETDPDAPQTPMTFTTRDEMLVDGLNSPLFDDRRLRILRKVEFRNFVLQEVLQLLSLSGIKKSRNRGRISYAQLGINQLGAVYEGLLSYTGFFAKEVLFEVAAAKDCKTLSGKPAAEREALKAYFVPESQLEDYKDEEIVRDENGRRVKHAKGSFIFRQAGRNREKSASFYTPEVLTQCLVKYALKELLYDEEGTRKYTADEMLSLTICEPAMGSSAFLIEAIDQLADAYLEARQEELQKQIPTEEYQDEKRRVAARLATNNCYGVDLNPVAVDLAKVSLWLGSLHKGGKCPWFGLRLAAGNSLIGARREVYPLADVTRRGTKDDPNWLDLTPTPVPLHNPANAHTTGGSWMPPRRPQDSIYHFLLPAKGMASFDKDKVIRGLYPEQVKTIRDWRATFTRPLKNAEAQRLVQMSDAADRLFAQVVRERTLAVQESSDRIPVWGEAEASKPDVLWVSDQEKIAAQLEDSSSAYRRLKLAMDYWCSLWFWPIEEADQLPDRATFLAQMELILVGSITPTGAVSQSDLFGKALFASEDPFDSVHGPPSPAHPEGSGERLLRLKELSKSFNATRSDYLDTCGVADVVTLVDADPTLAVVQQVSDRLRFHHWSLRFAEVFAARGGFDLIVGNPPWIKMQWKEGNVLADFDATLTVKKLSATEIVRRRESVLGSPDAQDAYLGEFQEMTGSQAFLRSKDNYPLLKGVQTNLYKCFITKGWEVSSPAGVLALVHPEGVYDDPKGGGLRRATYPRLRFHFQFINELKLFPEVDNHAKYSLNVYANASREPAAAHISNLFHPSTVDESFEHDSLGTPPGIKNDDGEWDLRGHAARIIHVDSERLALFASLYDKPGTPALEARLPVVHSGGIAKVLGQLASHPTTLGDLGDQYYSTEMWHETNAQNDGTIRRETRFPTDINEWILQGPHFYVGTPFNKTPNKNCSHNKDYTALDLTVIPADFLPRTNYVPARDPVEYARRTPKRNGRPVTDYYRHVHRRLTSPTGERTLVPTISPPRTGHVHPALSITFERADAMLWFNGLASSLPYDFFIKTTGKGDLYESTMAQLPVPKAEPLRPPTILRVLRLNCLTNHYADLWNENRPPGAPEWHRGVALRTDIARRQALVELDVLASMALELSLEDLLTIYRVQFPVLQQYERSRLYDQNGRIVPTAKTNAGEKGVSLVELAALLKDQAGFDITRGYRPNAPETDALLSTSVKLKARDAEVLGVDERCRMADLMTETIIHDAPSGDGPADPSNPVRLVGLRYTDPGLSPRQERVYPTPWVGRDREEDYRTAWTQFQDELGLTDEPS